MIVQKTGIRNRLGLSPQILVALSFLAAFLLGAFLLALPFSHVSGAWGGFVDSLFLATSAVCVTGLSPYPDLSVEFSVFGQVVLLLLAQLGALGIMTLGTFIIELVGRRASMKEEQMLMGSLGVSTRGRVNTILLGAIGFTVFWEVLGSLVLAFRFHGAYGYAPLKAAYYGVFHAVSGFCNAGLTLYPDSLQHFAADPVVLLMEAFLILVGGIGFVVHNNVLACRPWRRDRTRRGRLTLHSRIVLWMTLLLVLCGTLFYGLVERHGVFRDVPLWQSWLGAFFKTVTTRTCGFAASDEMAYGGFSRMFSMVLMLIGGAPGSTAGGLKVTTLVVLMATVSSMIRNREECEIGHRTIPMRIVRESIAILVLGAAVLLAEVVLLHCAELHSPEFFPNHDRGLSLRLVYEAVSACGTVGLSLNVTPKVTPLSKVFLLFAMLIGRLGPLTVATLIGGSMQGTPRRYPEEGVVVG